jgi:hypothetical protein
VLLGGLEHDARRSAEGPCLARGAWVEHPGLTIAIGDQAVAVAIDDGTGAGEAAAQTLVAISGGDLMAVDDYQRPAGQLEILMLSQVIQEVLLLRRPFAGAVVVPGDGDDPSLPGAQALQHIGVSDVPAVYRQITVRHQGLHPRIQAAVGVRKNGHSDHRSGAALYRTGFPVSRIAIACIALPPSVAGLCCGMFEAMTMRPPSMPDNPEDELEILTVGPQGADWTLILAHGAGQGMHSPFMAHIAGALGGAGVRVVRFELPYMADMRRIGKRKPPNREPVLLEHWNLVPLLLGIGNISEPPTGQMQGARAQD